MSHDIREPMLGRVRVTQEAEDRAIVYLEKRGWRLRTVAGLLNVHQESLKRALRARFGRARVERFFRR